jgi:hypothetical protein
MKIGDKVLFNGEEYKVTQELMGVYWGRKKWGREDIELPPDQIKVVGKAKVKVDLTKDEKGAILRELVEPQTLKENYVRELVLLNKMLAKYPDNQFWREHFKPALKVESLVYWLHRQEVEDLFKNATLDLTSPVKEIKLEDNKIGTDFVINKKPKNLLELLK